MFSRAEFFIVASYWLAPSAIIAAPCQDHGAHHEARVKVRRHGMDIAG